MKCVATTCVLLLSSCAEIKDTVIPEQEQEVWLSNEASTLGIDFNWISGASGEFHMPEIIGGGGASCVLVDDREVDI